MFAPRGCKIGCLTGVVALVAAVVFFVRWWTAPIDIPRPQRPPDPADNAYEVYRSLAAYTAQMFGSDSQLASAARELFPSSRQVRTDRPDLSRYLLQKMSPIRREYRQYLHKPCAAIIEYSSSWPLPELSEFRRWAKVEALDIALAAQEGDYARSVHDYRTVLLLSEQIRHQGLMMHGVTGAAMQALVNQQMVTLLPRLPARACDRLVEAVREWDRKHVPPTQILPSERGVFLSTLHDLYEGRHLARRAAAGLGLAIRWDPRWLNLRRAAHEGETFFRELEKEWQKPIVLQRRVPEPQHRVAQLLLPMSNAFLYHHARTEARIRLLACAAAVRAYRLRHGSYPSSLQEAGVADLNKDPFTGGEFVYKPSEQGFLLYSVGEDGKDDGGWRVSEVTQMGESGDISLQPFVCKPPSVQKRDEKGEPMWLL
ncbi:MAG: hypothetical protein ACUVSV_06585 [Armatimonadota bacterium]